MALLKIKQLRSNLRYNTTTNVLSVSGSLETKQTDPNIPSLAVSGAFYVVDSPNVVSGSYNGEPIDGGTF
jgi:hypothetical protein